MVINSAHWRKCFMEMAATACADREMVVLPRPEAQVQRVTPGV